MSAEDLEKYETEMELQLYREYRDVVGLFTHVVETERRFYLTNDVELNVRTAENGEVYFEVTMQDAWVWDMYRPARFVKNVRVVTFKDVNVEELAQGRARGSRRQQVTLGSCVSRCGRRRGARRARVAGASAGPAWIEAGDGDKTASPVHRIRFRAPSSTARQLTQRGASRSGSVSTGGGAG